MTLCTTMPYPLSMSSNALRESPNPILVHNLMFSSHLFLCLPLCLVPFFVPNRIVCGMPEGLEMWPYQLRFRFFTMVIRSSYNPTACWIPIRLMVFVGNVHESPIASPFRDLDSSFKFCSSTSRWENGRYNYKMRIRIGLTLEGSVMHFPS